MARKKAFGLGDTVTVDGRSGEVTAWGAGSCSECRTVVYVEVGGKTVVACLCRIDGR